MKSGFVGLIGRPNAGKSTLMNAIIGKKVAIVSNKPQTTRNQIEGIYNDLDTQIIFMDTPGIHKPNHKLGDYLNRQAYFGMRDVDLLLFLIDIKEEFGKGDSFILEKLKETQKPIVLVLNKIDKIKKEEILLKIEKYKDIYPFEEIVPVSALKEENIQTLIEVIKKYLKDDILYYEKEDYTNRPTEFLIAEIIREKVFQLTEEEVPHSLTCIIENIERKKESYVIDASIIVDRDSIKKIVVGKQGSKIKEIGIRSRKELEVFLGKRVYLNLFVKTIKNWRDKEKYLQEFGFKDFE